MSVPGYPHVFSKKEHRGTLHGQNRFYTAVETEKSVIVATELTDPGERVDIFGLTTVTIVVNKVTGGGTLSLAVKGSIDPNASSALAFSTPLAFTASGIYTFTVNVPYLWIGGTNTGTAVEYQLYATR
jgi:hypothetical protein